VQGHLGERTSTGASRLPDPLGTTPGSKQVVPAMEQILSAQDPRFSECAGATTYEANCAEAHHRAGE
jgi:hypothetical protein